MIRLAKKYLTILYILLLAEYARPQLLPERVSPSTEGVTVASNKATTDVNGGVEVPTTTSSSVDSLSNPVIATEGVEGPTEGAADESATESVSSLSIDDTITTLGPDAVDGTTDSHEEHTTEAIKPEPSTTSDENVEPATTKESTEGEDTTVSPIGACTTVGNFSNELDCHAYYTCSNTTEGLKRVDNTCPSSQAFNPVVKRCTLDISFCNNTFVCMRGGRFPDSSSKSSYFLCKPRVTVGFHLYRIRCKKNRIFQPQINKCCTDINAALTSKPDAKDSQFNDKELAKQEWKILRSKEKAKLKNEEARRKLKEKLEKKLEEKLEKKLEEKLKENLEEKQAPREKAQQEKEGRAKDAYFECPKIGKIPTSSSESQYFLCVNDKDKLMATKVSCPLGTTFHKDTRSCTSDDGKQLRLKEDEDNDDNSEDDGDDSMDEDD